MGHVTVIRSFIAGLGLIVLATACGDNIAGPRDQTGGLPGASSSVFDTTATDSLTAAALLQAETAGPSAPGATQVDSAPQLAVTRNYPLSKSITVSGVIGPKGGQIKIGEAGLTVVFSKGAVLQNTTITVTADSGSLVSYEFGPHGTQFLAPVAIEQDMQKTTIAGTPSDSATLYGGYLLHGTSDITGDSAKVSEFHAAESSMGTDSSGGKQLKNAVYVVWHFSGYILISVRR